MVLVAIFYLSLILAPVFSDECRLINMSPDGKEVPVPNDHVAYNKLKPFIGKRYEAVDTAKEFKYTIGICEPVDDDMTYKNAGVIQTNMGKPPEGHKKVYVVGMYNQTQLMSGNDWIMIEYWGGEPYGHHCSGEKRKATILIICNPDAEDGNPGMTILEENSDKNTDCYYLFEMSHKDACGVPVKITKSLSIGSIVLIIMASVIALYLLLGFLYQRFVLHAKGMEQMPNYAFWLDFGNLQADGCNLVCRSMSKSRSLPYKGIGDEQLEEDLDRTDDHLLPM